MNTESVRVDAALAREAPGAFRVRDDMQAVETALRETVQRLERYVSTTKQREDTRRTGTMSESELWSALIAIDAGTLHRRIAEIVAATVSESLTTSETASLLGVSQSTVSRRRSAGGLYAFHHSGRWIFASWQFSSGKTVPGVTEIVRSSASELHPVTVRGVMLAPRPTLNARGRPETPRDFLLRGGDVSRVLEIFDGM
jgi:Arc/MetJ family transcription regulator